MASTPSAADYVIVGGGTAGLVLANRLSEDPNVKVVVLETGPDRTTDPKIRDPAVWPTLLESDAGWQLQTVPQAGLNNRTTDQPQGRLLGGCSAINGLAFIAPLCAGIDAWARLGNLNWTWESLLPYFHKSYTLHTPDAETLKDVGVTAVDDAKKGAAGPIQVTYPAISQKNPLVRAWNDAVKELGYEATADLYADKAAGSYAYTAAIDPAIGQRSGADMQYGLPAS
ncbi:hypothetical protein VTN96DRAFT_5714 [Rasamsonia emersonii]